ncbi:MAG: phosphoglucomutase/phosphomannomutase family protein [Pedosphaera sp.]|nr:phosphoglucomutase/phosphomannomutase family protein [Pedosphaera sp.]
MSIIKFGTDGWRAVIAEDFTFANLDRVSQATADYWKSHPIEGTHSRKVVVGYDRRFLSDQFGARVAEIFVGNGFTVTLTAQPTPTPSVSFEVKRQKAIGGVMITASHNPAAFNGFKLKAWYGGASEASLCQAVEQLLDINPILSIPFAEAIKTRQIAIKDIRKAHYTAIKKLVNFELIATSELKFAHEALYGVGAGCFDELLAGTTCQVSTINAEHNPGFGGISPEPIAKNYIHSIPFLQKQPHDICLVTDGDADRVGGLMGDGTPLSTHQISCLLLRHYVKNRGMRGKVVKALTTTTMVDRMCASMGLELVETGVGFKYIAAEILKGGVLLGFEESGGIGFPKHIPERDGIAAGLVLLEMLAMEKKPLKKILAELEKEYGSYRYARIDAHFPLEKRTALMDFCKNNPPARLLKSSVTEVKSFDGVKFIAADGSWLMLRGSGTEPILRIYAEAGSDADAAALLKVGVRMTTRV